MTKKEREELRRDLELLTKEELIEFETEMAACFDDAMIRAPVHLYNDNEDQIIGVFIEIIIIEMV